MLETDPIAVANRALLAVAEEIMRGGDPNRLRGPLCALMRAQGQGKKAKLIEQLPPLPYQKRKL